MRKVNQSLTLVGLLAVTAIIAGCGSSSTSSTSSSASSSSAPSSVAAAKAEATKSEQVPTSILQAGLGSFTPKPGGTIYHVACNLALEGCTKLSNGIKAGTEAIGYKFKLCNGGTTPGQIAQCFQTAIAAKPTAIVVNGIGDAEAGASFAAAASAKVPIVGSFTGDTPGVKGVVTEVAGNACVKQAKEVANAIIADSEGKANVLFVGTNTFKCNIQRQQSFISQMKTCSSCKVSTLSFAIEGVTSQLPGQLQTALQSKPETTYVVGTFDAVALAATNAVRQAGKAGSIKVAGFDGDAPNLALVKKGEIQRWDDVTGGSEPGFAAVDAAARNAVGKSVPPVTEVTSFLVTQQNYAQIAPAYQGPTGYAAQFAKLWNKG
ncbi:MAG: ribose transport system substrate-binding protein [Thermoleophilaceae bacterium]|nr:ribose transport system substrate-binding protein [Thermoleophilaceae bacterium]